MKHHKILLICHLLVALSVNAQTFHSLPPGFNFQTRALCYDDSTNLLYIGGNFWTLHDGTPMRAVSVWDGTNWDSLGTGILGDVFTLAKYNNEIYAGGNFISAGGVPSQSIAKWDGNLWHAIGGINSSPPGSAVWELNVIGNDLYVLGIYDTINNMLADGISKFDGLNWYVFPTLNANGYFNACAIYNNELYVGGNFDGGPGLKDIAKFDGTSWVSVGGGLSGPNSSVDDMKIFQNKLYIVGNLTAGAGDHGNGIAVWDGTAWSQAGSGLLPGTIFSIYEFQGELYAGGQIFNAGGVPVTYIAKWDGNNWYSLGSIFDNGVGAFASNGPDLYISGGFRIVDGDSMNFITRYTNYVGLEEFPAMQDIWHQVYPNPSSEYLTIKSNFLKKGSEIVIYNHLNQRIFKKVVSQGDVFELDVSNFKNGLYYFCIIKDNISSEYGKLVVVH